MLNRQISCMEIDLDGKCDFQCPFCYFTKKQAADNNDNRLSFQEITGIIDQAKKIGVKKIILFTENSSMHADYDYSDPELKLYNGEFPVEKENNSGQGCSKLNESHDLLYHEDTARSLPASNHEFALHELLYHEKNTRDIKNIDSIIDFIPRQDMQVEVLFSGSCMGMDACKSVDIQCLKHKYSCFVTFDGIVYPCAGTPLSIGNLRETSLDKIINDSEVFENLVNHENMIKGPCRDCDSFFNCYGCRGRALSLTGDYLASDPLCSKNRDKSGMINYLPMGVEDLIPQKKGMRLVSVLLKVGERCAEVESVFSRESPFVKKDGTIEEIAYMEIMAQSAAVMDGFAKINTDAPKPGGFLIGGQDIKIYDKTRVGEKLITLIYKTVRFGNFGILTAKIMRKQDLIAEGEIKIYQYENP